MIVLEYYAHSLSLAQCSISEQGIVKLCQQTLQALAYINTFGVVHRCLAPDNILFDSKGNVKLFNYGLYYMTGQGGDVSFPIGYVNFFFFVSFVLFLVILCLFFIVKESSLYCSRSVLG